MIYVCSNCPWTLNLGWTCWRDGWTMVIRGQLRSDQGGRHWAGWAPQWSVLQGQRAVNLSALVSDLWRRTTRIQGCIFSARRSRGSSADRRLLTVIGCYLGGCQLKRQLSTFHASLVCLECQRSGALDVWSALAGRREFGGHLRVR